MAPRKPPPCACLEGESVHIRKLSAPEIVECDCCGTRRYGDGGDKILQTATHLYCSETCVKTHIEF